MDWTSTYLPKLTNSHYIHCTKRKKRKRKTLPISMRIMGFFFLVTVFVFSLKMFLSRIFRIFLSQSEFFSHFLENVFRYRNEMYVYEIV